MKNQKLVSVVLSVVGSFLGVAVIAYGAVNTTIGTNILTGGTLGVSGLSTLVNASTTQVSVSNALWVGGNATTTSAGNIDTKGTLTVAGATTLTGGVAGGLAITGVASVSATTTLSSGLTLGKAGLCIDFFATSTQTATKLEFDPLAATTTSPIGGMMLNYGSCN
jgi:hypothetical protein